MLRMRSTYMCNALTGHSNSKAGSVSSEGSACRFTMVRAWLGPWARIQAGVSKQRESRLARTQGTLCLLKTFGGPWHARQLWVWCSGGDNTRGGQPHRTFILRRRKPIPPNPCRKSTSYPQMAHRMKCWAPRGMDQRNHPGTGRDVRCVRSERSVGTYPAERLSLLPSDLPERQPVVLCSSQRRWCRQCRQMVPILSERKGEIAAKSCSCFQIQIWLPVMKQDIISYMFNVEDTRTKSMFIMHFGRQQLNREINYKSVCLWNIIYYYENLREKKSKCYENKVETLRE